MVKAVCLDRDDLIKWRDIKARFWAAEKLPSEHEVSQLQEIYQEQWKFWEEAHEKYELEKRYSYYITLTTGLIKYSEDTDWRPLIRGDKVPGFSQNGGTR